MLEILSYLVVKSKVEKTLLVGDGMGSRLLLTGKTVKLRERVDKQSVGPVMGQP